MAGLIKLIAVYYVLTLNTAPVHSMFIWGYYADICHGRAIFGNQIKEVEDAKLGNGARTGILLTNSKLWTAQVNVEILAEGATLAKYVNGTQQKYHDLSQTSEARLANILDKLVRRETVKEKEKQLEKEVKEKINNQLQQVRDMYVTLC